MTGRARLALLGGAVALPFAFLPLLTRPTLAIGLAVAVAAVALASRSVVYPVALAGIPSVVIGLSGGSNPLPTGVVTVGLFGWTAAAIAIAVLRSDDELPLRALFTPALLLTLLLAVLLVARLGSSLDAGYGSRKLQLFVMQNLVLLVGGLLIGRTRGRLRLWVVAALGMAVVSSLALTHQLLAGQTTGGIDGRLSLTQADNPILLGRDAARGLLLAIFLLLVARVAWLRLTALCAVPVIAVSFMAAGSRGPVVGLLAGLLVLLALTIANDAASRRRLILVFVAAIAAAALVPQLVPGGDIGRSLSIFSGTTEGVSSNGRSHLWSVAWQLFTHHPFSGDGTGSFAAFGGQFAQYPHNILLEAGAELGIAGILLVGGLIVITAMQLARILAVARGDDRADAALLAALFASAVVNAMLSGDLAVNSTVWLSAGLVGGLGRRTGTLLRTLDPAALVRGRGSAGHRRPSPQRPPGSAPVVSPGRIVSPEHGAKVGGAITVVVEPARLLRPLHSVRLEWSDGAGWREVACFDEQTFDLIVAGEPAAVVRSERLAHALADAVDAEAAPSPRRPWSAVARRRIVWDSSALDGAAGKLRAVTRALDGIEAATDPVALRIDRAAADGAPPPPRPRRLALLEAAQAQAADVERELADRERRLAAAEATVDGAMAALRRREQELENALAAIEEERRSLAARPVHEAPPDTTGPVVRIAWPPHGAVLEGAIVPDVDATDDESGVRSVIVQRSRDGERWQAILPGGWSTTEADDGRWLLRAAAGDHAGNLGRSAVVEIEVRNTVAPAPAAPAAPSPSSAPSDSARPTINELERLVAAANLGEERAMELDAMLFHLRSFADVRGAVPEQFDALIDEFFGDLLAAR